MQNCQPNPIPKADTTYLGNRTIREVSRRYLSKAPESPWTSHLFWRHDQVDAGGTVHYLTVLWDWDDATGSHSHKAWTFSNALGVWYTGLLQTFEEGPGPWEITTRRQNYTWTQDTLGNPYISSALTTLDPGQSYQKQSKTEQTLDTHGNVTQTKIYDYGNLTTPARTYDNTYLYQLYYFGNFYATRSVYNRLLTSTVSGGGQQVTLVSNTYDSSCASDRTGLRNHDTANYGPCYYGRDYRGNVWQRVANGVTTSFTYDITGMVTSASSGGHGVSVQPESGANNTVPGVITPNGQPNLAQSFDYSSFLGVTREQSPNGATTSFTFDSSARPTSTTSPRGVVTTYTYNDSVNERWSKATTGARWVKSTKDGLGRTVKVETGYNSTTVSTVDTEYDICACSPMGKVKRVSQPYAPNNPIYWTTYTYDDLGRTISVSQPDNSGTTSYLYQGNTVTVTDPVLKWKKYTVNALGNLTQVTEQPPTGANHETYYSYNLRGQLIGVSMPRGSTTQTRTFNYDLATGRLTSAVNPENGTVSYTYNPDGTVATRTQPMGRVEYAYDTYMRVTQIRRYVGDSEQTCQQSNFTYDQGSYGWGRLSGVTWGGASCTGGAWSYAYQYDSPGAITQKTQAGGGFTLTAGFTYNNLGQPVSTQYPNSGPLLTYTYDSMARPTKLTEHREGMLPPDYDLVKDVLYNAAGQITSMMMGSRTETRSYNALGQMTQQVIPGVLNKTYTFSATQNDGRITQMTDAISGETVQYQYDSLKRLTLAETSGSQWGQSFSYDGFGNLLGAVRTKGTAPQFSLYPDPTTNRLGSGYTFDANGNMTTAPSLTMTYDVENRMVEATHSGNGTEQYVYGPSNERVWSSQNGVSFYGADGTHITTCNTLGGCGHKIYFAGRLIPNGAGTDFTDRLGSTGRHFPYGDRQEPPPQTGAMFATYPHDTATTLDYARNRYYSPTAARFTTVDPNGASAKLASPQSWNKYSYAGNDPINHNDPTGQDYCDTDYFWVQVSWECNMEGYYNWYFAGYDIYQPPPSAPVDPLEAFRPLLSDLEGAVLGFGSVLNSGTLMDVTLTPSAYDYLADSGLLTSGYMAGGADVARLTMITCVTPAGQIVCAVAGAYLTYQALAALADWWIHSKKDTQARLPRPNKGVPTGTKPIDQMGWPHDQVEGVKKGVGAGPRDWVGISPDGNVITGDPNGNTVDWGHWSVYWP